MDEAESDYCGIGDVRACVDDSGDREGGAGDWENDWVGGEGASETP